MWTFNLLACDFAGLRDRRCTALALGLRFLTVRVDLRARGLHSTPSFKQRGHGRIVSHVLRLLWQFSHCHLE